MDTTIAALQAFDTDAALRLLGNNEKLYFTVLKRFHAQYSEGYEELAAKLLHGEDWELVQREAHTIKGLAGTIGHPALQQAALALELSIKGADSVNPEDVRMNAKGFLEVFSMVLCQLGRAFPE